MMHFVGEGLNLLLDQIKGGPTIVFQKNSFHSGTERFCGSNEGWSFSWVMKWSGYHEGSFKQMVHSTRRILHALSFDVAAKMGITKAAGKLLVLGSWKPIMKIEGVLTPEENMGDIVW